MEILSDPAKGRPILPLNHLSLPDRAGAKLSMWDWVKLIITTIPRAPAFWASRPAILDARLSKVHSIRLALVAMANDHIVSLLQRSRKRRSMRKLGR